MRDDSKLPMPPVPDSLQVSREASLPVLPSSSGAWFGSRRALLLKDGKFVRAHARYLEARVAQSDAMTRLVESRTALARSLAALASIADICRDDYERGRVERRIAALELQTHEAIAKTRLLEALQKLPSQHGLGGFSGSVPLLAVKDALGSVPELEPQTRETIERLLDALVTETAP
jgi:hypothetical protein